VTSGAGESLTPGVSLTQSELLTQRALLTQVASVEDVREVMHEAIAQREPLCIQGAATWTNAGPLLEGRRTLSLARLAGIIEYVPGDLTITAWAGTTLAELSHATAAHGQWLGLDPAGERAGTIGATIATASSGPLSHAFGTPRDLVLGLSAVTGYGDAIRAGGRVVKNVAGFDLVRLYTGSWGTLGAITSVTLRLRALPVHDVTLAIAIDSDKHFATLLEALRQNTVSLLACEWVDGASSRSLGASDGHDALLIRLGGNDAFIRGQRVLLDGIATTRECDAVVWSGLAQLDRAAEAVVRISGDVRALPSRIARIRDAAAAAGATLDATSGGTQVAAQVASHVAPYVAPHVAPHVALHGSVHRGTVRIVVTGDAEPLRLLLSHTERGEQRIAERLPDAWWRDEADAFETPLGQRIRAAFDPQSLCNRRRAAHA
jgi:glycolate oxidase FAD binding subunit